MVASAEGEKPLGANAFFDRMIAVRRSVARKEDGDHEEGDSRIAA